MKLIPIRYTRPIASFMVFTLLFQVAFPVCSYALTNGPSQPETQGFEPAGTSDLVDVFTGDFKYNIPLLDLDGYPVNLAYQANIGMEDEASWVGLGWSLNPGAIDRNVRGLPDDFKGDKITRDVNIRDNITFGVNGGYSTKVAGFKLGKIAANVGIFYNNYRGPGFEFGLAPTFSIANLNKSKTKTLKAGPDLSYNSQSGIDIGLSMGLSSESGTTTKKGSDLSLSTGLNSREGVKYLNFSGSASKSTDKTKNSVALQGGVSFGTPTYSPVPDLEFKTRSISLNVGFGGEVSPLFPHGSVGGFYTEQYLAEHHMSQAAYGYLHSTLGESESADNLLDFNKEGLASPYSDKMKKLPMSYGTYDLYSANAQGLSAQFRAFRGDVGIFRDAASQNGSLGANIGLELGSGNIAHAGGSVNIPWSQSNGGAWTDRNNFRTNAKFTDLDDQGLYEPVAFKDAGEPTIVANQIFYNSVGNSDPAYVELTKVAASISAESKLNKERNLQAAGSVAVGSVLKKDKRDRKNAVFSYLNGYEASRFGLDKSIRSYDALNSDCNTVFTDTKRNFRPRHHISEITVTQPGGSRYVFGIPVYNIKQKEVTMNTSATPPGGQDGPLATFSGTENSVDNSSGLDHYYEARSTPPYATSYLLSGLLSPDYIDLTKNGISDDDMGTAVKFNYTKRGLYKWRTPVGNNTGRYNPGNRADQILLPNQRDNKASYTSGERELWYMHSIESKNYIARFYTSERSDGLGVLENGDLDNGTNAVKLQKLDRIELYSRTEFVTNGSNATPLKTVHFQYEEPNTSLCLDVQNAVNPSITGKLTLKRIYFTYGKNDRGTKNVYKFDYVRTSGAGVMNYNMVNVDRWGMYKEQKAGYPLNNAFPYCYQPDGTISGSELDNYASAWNLNKITLPTGAEISVDYESDTYAYVMNKRAGQHLFIKGFTKEVNDGLTDELYSINFIGDPDMHYYMHVALPSAVTNLDDFKKRYLEGIENIYFNCRVQLKGGASNSVENITGYADYDINNITLKDNNTTAVIKLNHVEGDRGVNLNPIVKAALQTMRIELPAIAHPNAPSMPNVTPPNTSVSEIRKAIQGLFPMIQNIGDLILGFDKVRINAEYAQGIDVSFNGPKSSWVRLCNPTYNKYGGGSRVKRVSITDKWAEMESNGHSSSSYSTNYEYTTQLNGETISSGVASYEPILGNDENLWRQPLRYSNKNLVLGPRTQMYQELPVGEALFPGPTVGYSEVKVSSTPLNADPNNKRTATGYSINKFYTAKDFPTRAEYTTLHNKKHKPNPILKIFKFFAKASLGLTQGFVVEVNDMHGKPKTQETYNEAGSLIASTEYRYRTETNGRLKNEVEVIKSDNQIASGVLGIDMDIWEDMSQEEVVTYGAGVNFGVDAGAWGPIPAIFLHAIPVFHKDESMLRSSVTTKFIKRFGILDEVIKMQNGASLASKNLLYDSETGQPLLVEVQSEYDGSPVYQFNYPAHWAYDGMGQTYQNQDAFFKNITLDAQGKLLPQGVAAMLSDGDEIIRYKKLGTLNFSSPETYHVNKIGDDAFILNQDGGKLVSSSFSIKVKRSGRRNMATASVGSFQSLVNPRLPGANSLSINDATKVLQASAATYHNTWQIPAPYKRLNCTSGYDRNELDEILCTLVNTDAWFTTIEENKTLCDAMGGMPTCSFTLNGAPSNTIPFYTLTEKPKYGLVYEYQAQIGNCVLTLAMPDGSPFNPNDLTCGQCGGGGGALRSDGDATPSAIGYGNTCLQVDFDCLTCNTARCTNAASMNIGDMLNPYFYGIFGNWRPQLSYAYAHPNGRENSGTLKGRGYFSQFSPFWYWDGNGKLVSSTDKWVLANTVTKYDKAGNPIEEKDAINNYESALFGFKHSLPLATSSNCKYTQIAYDGYEDDGLPTLPECIRPCHTSHLSSEIMGDVSRSTVTAHTGKNAMRLAQEASITYTGGLENNELGDIISQDGNGNWLLGENGSIGTFQPISATNDRKYVISAWVYSADFNCATDLRNDPPQMLFAYNDGNELTLSEGGKPRGPIIDGWRKIEEIVTIPSGTGTFSFKFFNPTKQIHLDDVRVHPYDGSMQTFAYDPISLRLMATLDERNYATFYEYDDAGLLVRTKRETEKGIITVTESRSYLKPNNQ